MNPVFGPWFGYIHLHRVFSLLVEQRGTRTGTVACHMTASKRPDGSSSRKPPNMYIYTCLSEGGGIFLRCCKILFATARRCVNVDRDGSCRGKRDAPDYFKAEHPMSDLNQSDGEVSRSNRKIIICFGQKHLIKDSRAFLFISAEHDSLSLLTEGNYSNELGDRSDAEGHGTLFNIDPVPGQHQSSQLADGANTIPPGTSIDAAAAPKRMRKRKSGSSDGAKQKEKVKIQKNELASLEADIIFMKDQYARKLKYYKRKRANVDALKKKNNEMTDKITELCMEVVSSITLVTTYLCLLSPAFVSSIH
ncbi:hypothetical protein OIU84_003835 [Salix udensis]|uniref:Uncharacterized protein n=1 Tax=Salix udensis TaxID=889485 RepID=A0AAD6P3G3_9ROSI|nr:hypothetical protein OIU84_003835 [Salix udensis]